MDPINSIEQTVKGVLDQDLNLIMDGETEHHLVTALTNRERAIHTNLYHGIGVLYPDTSTVALYDLLAQAGVSAPDTEWSAKVDADVTHYEVGSTLQTVIEYEDAPVGTICHMLGGAARDRSGEDFTPYWVKRPEGTWFWAHSDGTLLDSHLVGAGRVSAVMADMDTDRIITGFVADPAPPWDDEKSPADQVVARTVDRLNVVLDGLDDIIGKPVPGEKDTRVLAASLRIVVRCLLELAAADE